MNVKMIGWSVLCKKWFKELILGRIIQVQAVLSLSDS